MGLLDHDDTIAPFALYEVVKVINEKPDVDFLYSDKDCLNENGERISPLFKPRWSPELMFSANYLTHFCVMRRDHVRAVGGWRPETDGAQDWDLFFRVVERSRRIEFIDKVLYHWGIVETSVASGGVTAKPYALRSQLQTIAERLSRIGAKGQPALQSNGAMRIRWELAKPRFPSASFWFQTTPAHGCWSTPGNCGSASVIGRWRWWSRRPMWSDNREGDILAVATPVGGESGATA